ncbi:MAG TPA: hypothetical protein PK453_00700 [Leptospiraceae bacterium]|nr:hypothetical protein [Leptospiraceae bacterium]HNF12158.1 hypothetical protein [Leptospiraceae bacterium]HNI25386.1 hypothetical protein [Leptospiraceae bacterium]HNM05025.1 hypothetical protein [Leptospiraceae bacterium]HNN03557.1 hypothetical protein [Leptospiraceae bacterium]
MAIALANPIYDTVFKFLLEDLDIARELISEIIHQEILSIEVRPQESTVTVDKKTEIGLNGPKGELREHTPFLTVYRLDFLAEIRTGKGTKKVLIELQKAKLSTDIMRFRKYLGEQYSRDSLPIITIYFIGYAFDRTLPKVIEVARVFRDRLTGNDAERQKNEFIDSLTHDSFVIQLFELKTEMRNRLEKALSVFSQAGKKLKDHIVYYDFPLDDELQQKIVNRLNYAVSDEILKRQMDLEEEILMELQDMERKIENQEKTIEEKDRAIEEKDRTIEEKEKTIEEKEKALEESRKTLDEKDRLILELMKKLENR